MIIIEGNGIIVGILLAFAVFMFGVVVGNKQIIDQIEKDEQEKNN